MKKGNIQIVFDGHQEGLLRKYTNYNQIINVSLDLDYVNISNVLDYSSRYEDYLKEFEYLYDAYDEFEFHKIYYDNLIFPENHSYTIWYDTHKSDERCGFYFICHLLQNEELYVSDNYLSCKDEATFRKLSEGEKKKYSDLWVELVKENADLRILENNEIVSHSYRDYFDEITSSLSNKEISYSKLLFNLLDSDDCLLSYTQLFAIINTMIKENKLVITKRILKDEYYGQYDLPLKRVFH